MLDVEISIPDKYAKWFKKHRNFPVRVQVGARSGCVSGGSPYSLHRVSPVHITAYRQVGCSTLAVGEITSQCLLRPISEAARHDLGVIRAAIFKTSYPAPLAYEMGNKDLVHPGSCFNKHASVLIRRTLFSVGDEEAHCVICKETFE
jgi:hypothetical protein